MKSTLLKTTTILFLFVCLIVGCSNDDNAKPAATNDTVITVPFFTINENGEMPTAPDQLIYELRKANPITAPDGHHLTWAEFSTVNGTAEITCQDNGAKAELTLTGLIPNGVYTIWNIVFDAPGMDPTDPMLGLDGLGAAGIGDGSDNAFTASSDGTASITFTSPEGHLSMIQNTALGACPLTDNFEWHIVGAYHMDNQTYGPMLGPDGTVVEQFGFIFKNEDN